MAHVRKAGRVEAAGVLKGVWAIGAVFLAGFVIGRVKISDDLWPFGTAFVIASFVNGNRVNPYAALAGVLAALATQITSMGNVAYNFSVVTICAVILIGFSCVKGRPSKRVAIVAGGAAYGLCTLLFKLTLIMNMLSSLAEAAICAMATIMLSAGIKAVGRGLRRNVITDEEIISGVFALMLVILGIGQVNVAGVYLRHIALAYLAITGAFSGGSAVGAAVGGIGGLACILAGDAPALLALSVLPGMLAGALRRFKKPGVMIGYLASYIVMALYVSGMYGGLGTLFSAAIGTGLFLVTPKAWMDRIGAYIDGSKSRERTQELHERRFSRLLHAKVKAMSAALDKAADAAEFQSSYGREMDRLVSAQAQSICQTCGKRETCWEQEDSRAYEETVKLFEQIRAGAPLGESPGVCARLRLYQDTALAVWDKYLQREESRKKAWEGRKAAGNELHGTARVLDALARDFRCELRFREDIEEEVRTKLEKHGIAVKEVWADMAERTLKVGVQRKKCGKQGGCIEKMTELVSDACGAPMTPAQYACPMRGEGPCTATFVQEGEFQVISKSYWVVKEGKKVSGDVCLEEELSGNRYMMVICDGMGHGQRARRESAAAASLALDFYRAGFDDRTVAEAVNKMMLTTGGEEMFSTVDICMVDCSVGSARFMKTGAPHSYLVRGEIAEEIGGGSLPVGILDNVSPNIITKDLMNGDIILMMSDGVSDRPNINCGLISDVCASIKDIDEIARTVLDYAINNCKGTVPDDMTVIGAKIVKNQRQ